MVSRHESVSILLSTHSSYLGRSYTFYTSVSSVLREIIHAIEMNIPLNRCNWDDHTKVKITLHFCSVPLETKRTPSADTHALWPQLGEEKISALWAPTVVAPSQNTPPSQGQTTPSSRTTHNDSPAMTNNYLPPSSSTPQRDDNSNNSYMWSKPCQAVTPMSLQETSRCSTASIDACEEGPLPVKMTVQCCYIQSRDSV